VKPDFVYLLVAADGGSFKIGRSFAPARRAMWLPDQFDFVRSRHYRLYGRDARRLENALHFLFRHSRVERPKSDGSTEWFDISAFGPVVGFLAEHKALIGWDVCEPVTRQTLADYVATREALRAEVNAERRHAYAEQVTERAPVRPPSPQRRGPPPRRSWATI